MPGIAVRTLGVMDSEPGLLIDVRLHVLARVRTGLSLIRHVFTVAVTYTAPPCPKPWTDLCLASPDYAPPMCRVFPGMVI